MINYTILCKPEDEWETSAIVNAAKNKRLLDGIYDEVFRPIIKHGSNKSEKKAYELVWCKMYAYLEDE